MSQVQPCQAFAVWNVCVQGEVREKKWEDKGLLLLSGHAAVALQRAEGSS